MVTMMESAGGSSARRPLMRHQRGEVVLVGHRGQSSQDVAEGVAEGNTAEGNKWHGIKVADFDTAPTLRDNTARNNGKYGIYFSTGAKGVAEGNTAEGNEDGQIQIGTHANPRIGPDNVGLDE